jgi:hypothetical protein
VFDPRFGAALVERLRARRGQLAQAEEAVAERRAPRPCRSDQWRSNGSIGAYRADADRAGTFEVTEAAPLKTHRVARSMATNRERRAFGGKTVHRTVF